MRGANPGGPTWRTDRPLSWRKAQLPLAFSLGSNAVLLALLFLPAGAASRPVRPVNTAATPHVETQVTLSFGRDRPESSPAAPPAFEVKGPADDDPWEGGFVIHIETPPAAGVTGPSRTNDRGGPGSGPDSDVAGRAGAPGVSAVKGRGAGLGLFTSPTAARSVVFVIDRSLSMGLSGAFDAARRELLAGLEALPPSTRFLVVFYDRRPEAVGPAEGLVPAAPEVVRQVAARVEESQECRDGTDHLAALLMALRLQPEVIFLVTDADGLTPSQVREVTRVNRGRSAVHCVELTASSRSRADGSLATLARLNRGTYRLVNFQAPPPE